LTDEVFVGSIQDRIVGNTCPHCGRTAEGGSAFDIGQQPPQNPKPGDYAICLYCGTLNRYGDGLKLRLLTKRDRRQLMRDPRLRETLQIVQQAAKGMRRRWQ
jgi:hypothetical protein